MKTIPTAFIALSLCLFNQFSSAQVVYTDVNPDITSISTYNLDLNNDGTIDFVITKSSATVTSTRCSGTHINSYIRISPTGSNQVSDYSSSYPTKMAISTVIGASTLTWNNVANQLMTSFVWVCAGFTTPFYWHVATAGQWYAATDGC